MTSALTREGDRIKFKTKIQKGLSYEFEGQFFARRQDQEQGHFDDNLPHATTVLRGVFKTIRSGKLTMSEELSFFYTRGE